MKRKPVIAANWKMNVNWADIEVLLSAVIKTGYDPEKVDVIVSAPFTYLYQIKERSKNSSVITAAQNVSNELKGAFTGEISVEMLNDLAVSHCIVGHSERRHYFFEDNKLIGKKARILLENDLIPIICIGEQLAERESGKTERIIEEQLDQICAELTGVFSGKILIAYEPVWAIGTGQTASPEQAENVHKFIRSWLKDRNGQQISDSIRILYGGSMNAENAASLLSMENIDGGLIGSASLDKDQFISLIQTGEK